MELILAILIGVVCIFRGAEERGRAKHVKKYQKKYDDLNKLIFFGRGAQIEYSIEEELANRSTRELCFDSIDSEMTMLFGCNWREMFDNAESRYHFENRFKYCKTNSGNFMRPEVIALSLLMAKRGQVDIAYKYNRVFGKSPEEGIEILRKFWKIIQKELQEKYPDHHDDLQVYYYKTDKIEGFSFKFEIEYLQFDSIASPV